VHVDDVNYDAAHHSSMRHHRLPNIQDGRQQPEVVSSLAISPNIVVVPIPKQESA